MSLKMCHSWILGDTWPSVLGIHTCGAARLRKPGAPAGGYMWAICTGHVYLWDRPAEEARGSSRRLYVGHLYLAYVFVGPPG